LVYENFDTKLTFLFYKGNQILFFTTYMDMTNNSLKVLFVIR